MNQGSNFLGWSLSNRDNVRSPIQFRKESQPQHLKTDFSSRTDPSIFTSIAPVLLDQSNETSWVYQHWSQQAISCPIPVSCRPDLSSEVNSSCCHRSDAWIESLSSDTNITDNITGVSVKFWMVGETNSMVGYHLMTKDHSVQLGLLSIYSMIILNNLVSTGHSNNKKTDIDKR